MGKKGKRSQGGGGGSKKPNMRYSKSGKGKRNEGKGKK